MARVTIQDCLLHIPSRFDLTMVAAKRARQLTRGAEAKLPWNGHKSTVLALQEIDLPVIKPANPTLDGLDPFLDVP